MRAPRLLARQPRPAGLLPRIVMWSQFTACPAAEVDVSVAWCPQPTTSRAIAGSGVSDADTMIIARRTRAGPCLPRRDDLHQPAALLIGQPPRRHRPGPWPDV